MKTMILMVLSCVPIAAQIPDAPKPHIDRMEISLLAADAGVRALDVYSTRQMLDNGGHEMFLPNAIASRPAAMAGLEAGDILAVAWLSRRLERHGHARLAHILTAADAAQDAPWAIHNLFIRPVSTPLKWPTVHAPIGLQGR